MCVSVFELPDQMCSKDPPRFVTDICCEQLGTGISKPLRSQWSWLGVDVTESGDVIITDMDMSCVYLV